jgi:hypothetical protein
VKDMLKLEIPMIKSLSKDLKLPDTTITRLIDIIVFSHLEGKGSNPNVHRCYRLLLKKRLYIRCMKVYPDLFKGKKEMLELKAEGKNPKTYEETVPFIWNSSIEGDELCVEVLK